MVTTSSAIKSITKSKGWIRGINCILNIDNVISFVITFNGDVDCEEYGIQAHTKCNIIYVIYNGTEDECKKELSHLFNKLTE